MINRVREVVLEKVTQDQRGIRLSRCKCAWMLSFSASAHHILANDALLKTVLIRMDRRLRARYLYWQFAILVLRKAQ